VKKHNRRHFLRGAAGSVGAAAVAPVLGRLPVADAAAAITCPNPIKAVHENHCTDTSTWSTAFQLAAYDGSIIAYAASTSWDLYEVSTNPARNSLVFHIGQYGAPAAGTPAEVRIYRLGYYGAKGGRLIYKKSISIPPMGANAAMDPQTGRLVANGATSFEFSDFVAPASGVYLAKVVAASGETHVPFIVRDDQRVRDVLVGMPTNTWLAYNPWAGKSLYDVGGLSGADPVTLAGTNPATGDSRGVKVSFDRPWGNQVSVFDWLLHTEFPLIYWLERMGYDVAYTEDVAVHLFPWQLYPGMSKAYVIAGHSEYWTQEMYDAVKTARSYGTHIAAFGANTAYWRVRYEDGERTVSCYKTIQGTGPQTGGGKAGVNDPSATLNPPRPTTTARDRGAAAGAAEAPAGGRVGVSQPENEVFGVFYVGDDGGASHGIKVPSGAGAGGEFGAHRAWRNTALATTKTPGATIGTNLLGWEWDAIPSAGALHVLARSVQPAGVKRLAETDPTVGATSSESYLTDDGRARATAPPTGISKNVHMAIHTAPSGAIVFSTGSMQLSWGLGPHYGGGANSTYLTARTDNSDSRIQQLVYNVLADMGVKPNTPDGVTLDKVTAKTASFRSTRRPALPAAALATKHPHERTRIAPPSVAIGPGGTLAMDIFVPETSADDDGGLTVTTRVTTGKRRTATLAHRTFPLKGRTRHRRLDLRLSQANRKLLADRGQLTVNVETISRDRRGRRTKVRTPLVLVAGDDA
jgi:hypothetical protein